MSAISNLPSEESVLGSLMVSEPALGRVIDADKLRAGDFYLDKHRAIYETILDLHKESQPVDELTVITGLGASNIKVKLHRIRKKLFVLIKGMEEN